VDDLRTVPESFGGVAVTRDGAYYAPRQGEMGLAGGLPTTVLLERRTRLSSLSARVGELEREAVAARARAEEASAAAERAATRRHEASRAAASAREAAQRAERESARADDRSSEIAGRLARARREREAQSAEIAEAEDDIERLDAVAAASLVRIEELSPPVAAAEEELVGLEERQVAALSALTRARVELEERTAAAERLARERAEERRRAEEGRRRLEELERRLAASPAIEAAARALSERFVSLQRCAAELADRLEAPAGDEAVDRGLLRDLAETEAGLRRRAEELAEGGAAVTASVARLEEQRTELAGQLDEAGASLEQASFEPPADEEEAAALEAAVERTRRRIERIGPVNPLAEAECAELGERAGFLREQRKDLERSLEELDGLIEELTGRIDNGFAEMFAGIREHFADMVGTLFPGGRGSLFLVEGEGENDSGGVGVEIKPGRKSGKRLTMLSGGERALAAIAFLMALVLANPAPFYILDEIEAALDDVNIGRLVTLLRRYRERTQFIIITHQKRTMEAADLLYGVTMGSDGVSHVVSARMAEEEIDREAAEQSRQKAIDDGMA
jgi:chromosome segregation protein